MQKELIDMLERVLQEAITQDPFQGDDYALLHEAEALLAKAKAAQQSVQLTAFGVGMLAFCAGFCICWFVFVR